MKIAVLTSGGVDSSVALRLLHEQGHDVTAFYLKIWLEDELQYLGECPWEEDLEFVQKICSTIGVPLEIVPMQREYWDRVVSYTVAEAKAGRTPNPDILCNQQIKFGQFYDYIGAKAEMPVGSGAEQSDFEKVATGHYAQVEEVGGQFVLKKAPDPIKDQTYFLSHLSQKQLSRAMFPIGHMSKSEVRELAEKYDLPNKDRKDSQGICFLGKIPFQEFIKEHLGEKPGDFINQATLHKVGEHKGFWFYTIGQRNGLGLSGGPWFVVDKDPENNVVFLAHGYEPPEVMKDEFEVGDLHWISGKVPDKTELQVKIRHGESIQDSEIRTLNSELHVQLKGQVHGVAPGQFAVFYDSDICLGGGTIC